MRQISFSELPTEMIWNIFSFLPAAELEKFLTVDTRLSIIANNYLLGKTLKETEKAIVSGHLNASLFEKSITYFGIELNHMVRKEENEDQELSIQQLLEMQFNINLISEYGDQLISKKRSD